MQPNQQPSTPPENTPATPHSTPGPSTIGGIKPPTPMNTAKSIRTGWILGAISILILLMSFFVTATAVPLGALLGAWALYAGIRLKQKGLIVIGSIGSLNLLVYIYLMIQSTIAG